MPDDIVKRLRHIADMGGRLDAPLEEAADEIERLRQHKCQWCGTQWEADSNLYDECGDCYRKHQALTTPGDVSLLQPSPGGSAEYRRNISRCTVALDDEET